MKSLQAFHNNKDMKENVHNYLISFIRDEAVERVFNREDVSAVADAKEMIDKAFSNLEVLFEPEHKNKEQINEAR